MADIKRIYWDSCVWIGLINEEPDKVELCKEVLRQAKAGEVEIWTSSLTLAEVFKRKCGVAAAGIDESSDRNFESYIQQEFLVEVQVDHDVGVTARRLLRAHPELKKPMDAIHLATAALNNVDEMHTFDGANLLSLDRKVSRADGSPLRVLVPELPAGHQPPLIPDGLSPHPQVSSAG